MFTSNIFGLKPLTHPMNGARGIFFPFETCDHATLQCKYYCSAKKKPMVSSKVQEYTLERFKSIGDEVILEEMVISQIKAEMRGGHNVLHWFGSGDMPDDEQLEYRVYVIMERLSNETKVPQVCFSRNLRFISLIQRWLSRSCACFLTVEHFSPDKPIIMQDEERVKNIAVPDYVNGFTHLWKLGPMGDRYVYIGGCATEPSLLVAEPQEYKIVPYDKRSGGCWECYKKKIGCFYSFREHDVRGKWRLTNYKTCLNCELSLGYGCDKRSYGEKLTDKGILARGLCEKFVPCYDTHGERIKKQGRRRTR